MGPTFSTILNEFWTDFLQFSAKDGGGGCHTPPHPPLMCAPALIAEDCTVHVHVKPAVLEQIGKDQYGCIPHSFTSHALINMIHQWTKATDGTGASVRVFVLEYKRAFDLIDHNILINKLSMFVQN